jgi:hypothetical protein
MSVEIGEAREAWGKDVWKAAENYANAMKSDREPFYIVFAAKQDKTKPGVFRQSFRFYRQRPPKMFGILVWYCDHSKSLFKFVPELSAPPDVPLDPKLLSKDGAEELPSVMEKGKELNALLS